ncbi:MAG: GIY-YIG nuclease family protein [Candidatus Spechtbacterales bacterium]
MSTSRRRSANLATYYRALKLFFMYYVYVIKNIKTSETYMGYTEDLKRRMKEHKDKNPQLIYYEAYRDKRDAQVREIKLKQRGQSIRWLKARLKFSLK